MKTLLPGKVIPITVHVCLITYFQSTWDQHLMKLPIIMLGTPLVLPDGKQKITDDEASFAWCPRLLSSGRMRYGSRVYIATRN